MRTKRSTRDKLETQAFFNQLPACSCRHCRGSHQTPCDPKAAERITCTDISHEISAATKALKAATSHLESACKTHNDDEPHSTVQPEVIDTFELEELEEFVAHYDEVYDECASIEEDFVDTMGEKIDATDECGSAADMTEARARNILCKQRQTNASIDSCLCTIQFFNVDKKFNFVKDGFEAIAHQHEARHGESSPPLLPPTLTHDFNDPIGLLVDELKANKKPIAQKHLNAQSAMLSVKRLCVLAVKDVQAVNKSISDGDYYRTITDNADTVCSRMSTNIPEYIRQAIVDFDFLCDEIVILRERIMWLRDHIRCTMIIWMSTSKEAWEYGKTHIHDFPDMRRYEYQRISLRALYVVWLREEAKIFHYCDRHGGLQALDLKIAKIKKDLEIRNMGWQGLERDWESSSQELKTVVSSVEDMVKQLECAAKNVDSKTEGRGDD